MSENIKLAVYFDDINRIQYPKGIVINGSIFADKSNYSNISGQYLFLGIDYQVVRREFWSVPKKNINKEISVILLTMGGGDDRNMTPLILKILKDIFPSILKNVIVGKLFNNIFEISELVDDFTKLIYNPSASDIRILMENADIAVSAAGQTLYELAVCGVPMIMIEMADNQRNNIKSFTTFDLPFVNYIDVENDVFIEKLVIFFNYLKRVEISQNLQVFFTGNGAVFTAKEIISKFVEFNNE